MISRYVENKIIKFMIKNGNKFKSENFFRKILKSLVKKNKKTFNYYVYFSINHKLVAFKLEKIKKVNNRTKIVKNKPIFILFNKNKLFISIKDIFFNNSKVKLPFIILLKNKIIEIVKSENNQNDKQILQNQNSLLFYRW